jgi:integrase
MPTVGRLRRPGFEARRDTAIIMLLLDTGTQRAELADLQLAHVDLDLDVLLLLGKGLRERALPLDTKPGKPLSATSASVAVTSTPNFSGSGSALASAFRAGLVVPVRGVPGAGCGALAVHWRPGWLRAAWSWPRGCRLVAVVGARARQPGRDSGR